MNDISELKFDDKNPNKHNPKGMSLIEKSLSKFGAGRSILIDKHGNIIAGNGVIEAAGNIGLEDIEVIKSDGKKIIAVQRTDIELDSEAGREMALADNATAKEDIEWDFDNIMSELEPEVAKEWLGNDIELGIESEKNVKDNPPTITSSFITIDYSDEIELKIEEETAQKLMSELLDYKKATGTYEGFWDVRLK